MSAPNSCAEIGCSSGEKARYFNVLVGFFFPVVPRGQARIRVQISAVHERVDLERAVAAFTQAGRELRLVS